MLRSALGYARFGDGERAQPAERAGEHQRVVDQHQLAVADVAAAAERSALPAQRAALAVEGCQADLVIRPYPANPAGQLGCAIAVEVAQDPAAATLPADVAIVCPGVGRRARGRRRDLRGRRVSHRRPGAPCAWIAGPPGSCAEGCVRSSRTGAARRHETDNAMTRSRRRGVWRGAVGTLLKRTPSPRPAASTTAAAPPTARPAASATRR
jgi:hypothetical protein